MRRNYYIIALTIAALGFIFGFYVLFTTILENQYAIKDQTAQRSNAVDKILEDSSQQTLILCILITESEDDVRSDVREACEDYIDNFNKEETSEPEPQSNPTPTTESNQSKQPSEQPEEKRRGIPQRVLDKLNEAF